MLAEGLPRLDRQEGASARPAEKVRMTDQEVERFINATVDLFTQSSRTPVLRTPDEYGMPYEDVFLRRDPDPPAPRSTLCGSAP